jgi:hypothetical protein
VNDDRFTVWRAKFETLSKRLHDTRELSEKHAVLNEMRKILDDMEIALAEYSPLGLIQRSSGQ